MLKLVPLITPSIDLRAFTTIVGQGEVNQIDAKRIQPPAKFAELADASLWPLEGSGYRHLFVGFYFEVPFTLYTSMNVWEHFCNFRVSIISSGMIAKGIITGPFDLWKEFLINVTNPHCDKLLRGWGDAVYQHLKAYTYFQDLTIKSLSDGTFTLGK